MTEPSEAEVVAKVKADLEDEDRIKLAKTYEHIQELIKVYVDMNPDYYPLVGLWVIGTYIYQEFPAYPFLYINAQRGSGKTRLLKIISHLAKWAQGQVQTGITESVLFRSLKGSTLIMDECESIASRDKAVLREYLNACYKKGATVKRSKKVKSQGEENYQIESFEPYRPIAMANIQGMNDVLGDRCLTLILEKSNNPIMTKLIENFDKVPDFFLIRGELNQISVVMQCRVDAGDIYNQWNNYIRDKYSLYTTTQYPLSTLHYITTSLYNKIDESSINGRNLELVMPLLLIASFMGEEVFDNTLKIVKRIIDSKRDEEFSEDKDVSLIDFVSTKDASRYIPINVNDLTRQFREFLGEIESEDRWLNAKWMGKALKRLNLIGLKKRKARGVEIILAVDRAKEKIKMFKAVGDANEDS